jgi:membrane associated rhomboid family serine protease
VASCPTCGAPLQVAGGGSPGHYNGQPPARLTLRAGPGPAGTQVCLWGDRPVEVGKLAGKQLLLPGRLVSRNHCRLIPSADGWAIDDEGSTNGTFVNGHRVRSQALAGGDVLRIGEYEFTYDAGARAEGAGSPAAEDQLDLLGVLNHTHARPSVAGRPPPPAKSGGDEDFGLYDIVDEPAPPPPPARHAPAYVTRINASSARPAPPPVPMHFPAMTCPACARTMSPGVLICTDCGIDLRTGRALITSHGVDENVLQGNAETTVRVISWLIPFGLYPIASEAFGARKPYVIWAVAALTVLTSIIFWGYSQAAPLAAMDLELWAGSPSASSLARLHGRSADEDDLDEALQQYLRPVGEFQPHQLITHAFLHAGIMHLAGNMMFLMVFGTRVNALLGQWKTAVLYPLLAVIAGGAWALSQRGEPPTAMIGASGAIMGLAGMYIVLFPVHRVHNVIWLRLGLFTGFRLLFKIFSLRGYWVVLFYIAFDVLFTALRLKDNVAHWAHLGGFIGGAVIAIGLLVSRQVNAHGGDLFSVILGRPAWALIGKPRAAPAA